jgi:hypothetical protein
MIHEPTRQNRRCPPKMTTGEIRATTTLTEPAGDSALQAMRTAAGRDTTVT